jgi:uncharacterized protein (TIGR02266 family)
VVERERRAHPRKLVSTGVSFNDLEGATLRGWLRDISRGGCFVATPSLFTFGEELTIVMTLPFPRQRVVGRVRVVWVREKNDKDMPAGMGMEFVEVNDDALVAIDKLASGSKLSRPNTFIGIAPPAAGSSPSYSDVKIPPLVPLAMEPTLPAEAAPAAPKIESAAPLSQTPKKGGREKWLIGGAAAISVGGLIALGVVYSRHAKTNASVDAAVSATASVSATATASETAPSATASATAIASAPTSALPIVDASAPDAAPRDAGADGGKKKPTPKIKRR